MKLKIDIVGTKEVHMTAALRAITDLVELGYDNGTVFDNESKFQFTLTGVPQEEQEENE